MTEPRRKEGPETHPIHEEEHEEGCESNPLIGPPEENSSSSSTLSARKWVSTPEQNDSSSIGMRSPVTVDAKPSFEVNMLSHRNLQRSQFFTILLASFLLVTAYLCHQKQTLVHVFSQARLLPYHPSRRAAYGPELNTTECTIPPPEKIPVPPTITSSYPGSGAKLTWKLIRAITGMMTSDDYDHNGLAAKGNAVALKTHYPSHTTEEVFTKYTDIPRAMLLLRCPLHALPSLCNYDYEREKKLKNHSTRAPIDYWVKWREEKFDKEIKRWVHHVRYWMERYPFEQRVILSYERLTSEPRGPDELGKIADFLAFYPQVAERLAPKEEIGCLWYQVVKKRPDESSRKSSLRKGGPEVYPFTLAQILAMLDAVDGLAKEWPGQLGTLMGEYGGMLRVEYKRRKDEGERAARERGFHALEGGSRGDSSA